MSTTAYRYAEGLRWETRLVISFIVVACCSVLAALYSEIDVSIIITSTMLVVGTVLAAALRSLLRKDYVHTHGWYSAIAFVPPLSFSTLFVGMLSSWMQRVGFGIVMRIGVTSLLLWSTVAAGLHLTTFESTIVLAGSVATAVVRQVAVSSLFLAPWALTCIGAGWSVVSRL